MDDMEFYNLIFKFDLGVYSHYFYEELKTQLLDAEDWAFSNSDFLYKKHKLDVKDIYRQLYEFERVIEVNILSTITKTREEGTIFALLSYAQQNRPIIESKFTEQAKIYKLKQKDYNPETERLKEVLSHKVRYQSNLLAFYIDNHTNEECYTAIHSLFHDYMKNSIRLNKYDDYNEYDIEKLKKLPDRYDNGYILHYLKLLIKHKDIDIAKQIYTQFPLTPTNKKETESYESIKKKLDIN